MDYLVTGANGQLGRAVLQDAASRGASAVGATHAQAPVEDAERVRALLLEHRPRWVVHCAAWTDVDGCERDPERAQRINAQGTGNVVDACLALRAGLLYVSTDFVFDGSAHTPYAVSDRPAPLSAYGRSKLAGEQLVLRAARPTFFVVRTSWVFGPGGRNFPRAILERARSGAPLRVVDDQVGRPTLTLDLAPALLDLCERGAPAGIYHAANEGTCSWYDFAAAILQRAGIAAPLARMASAELDRPARRPAYSVLDCSRLTAVRGTGLPHWERALERYLAQEMP